MTPVEHSLKFVTEFDETNPVAQQLLRLDKDEQTTILNDLLKSLIVPSLQPLLDELNANNSYATLKVVK
jgi:hypothetical protein